MAFTPKVKEKWAKVLTLDMMSSEESDESDDDAIIVRPLRWRHDRVAAFLHNLDERSHDDKSPQAKRQTKKRKQADTFSLRPLPATRYSSWATTDQ